jgi:Tfp pilus assembly PilM family ATPase
MGISNEEAKLLRLSTCNVLAPSQAQAPSTEGGALNAAQQPNDEARAAAADAAGGKASDTRAQLHQQALQVQAACRDALRRIVEELDLCRRYYEATFPSQPVDRLVFVGGEAKHRNFCQFLAQEVGLVAQVGDPLMRMGKFSTISPDSGIDRRQPQPNWAVALGLSMGPGTGAGQLEQAA